MADAFDVFGPMSRDVARAIINTRNLQETGLFAKLPAELLHHLLSKLPAVSLAAISRCCLWLERAVSLACVDAAAQTGLLGVPERRLGEGMPCIVRRAELRMASRRSSRLAAGFQDAIYLDLDEGAPRFFQVLEPRAEQRRVVPALWRPEPPLPRTRALAVAAGANFALVLLDDYSVVRIGLAGGLTPPAGGALADDVRGGWRVLRPAAGDGASGEQHERSVGVGAGALHGIIVGERGGLFTCGRDDFGQCGLGARRAGQPHAPATHAPAGGGAGAEAEGGEGGGRGEHMWPQRVVAWSGRALQADGGGFHTLVLTSAGGVFACGHGGGGRLGLGDEQPRRTLCRVPLPGGGVAVAVAAGGDFSLILTEAGEIFGFGPDAHGVLGREGSGATASGSQLLPSLVPMPRGAGGERVVRRISAGYDHALAVTASGIVLSWGSPAAAEVGEAEAGEAEAAAEAAAVAGGGAAWSVGYAIASGDETAVPAAEGGGCGAAHLIRSPFGQLGRPRPLGACADAGRTFAPARAPGLEPPSGWFGEDELVAAGSTWSLGVVRGGGGGARLLLATYS